MEIRTIEELDAVLQGASEAQADMHLRMEIDLALTLRRTADRALAVKQQSAAGSAFGYVHVHATDLLLVERITAGGMHLFTLAGKVQDAVTLVQPPLCDPPGPMMTTYATDGAVWLQVPDHAAVPLRHCVFRRYMPASSRTEHSLRSGSLTVVCSHFRTRQVIHSPTDQHQHQHQTIKLHCP